MQPAGKKIWYYHIIIKNNILSNVSLGGPVLNGIFQQPITLPGRVAGFKLAQKLKAGFIGT